MKRMRWICLALLAAPSGAGPLAPPAGPIASTNKTLTEVEPRTAINAANTPGGLFGTFEITKPGSYYLAGDITGVAARHGIYVATDNVTIDLNGFSVVATGTGLFSGISVSGNNVVIRNGTVRGWKDSGVGLSSYKGCRIENVSAVGCLTGLFSGQAAIFERCSAIDCSTGFTTGLASLAIDCQASNSDRGCYLGTASEARGCHSSFAKVAGFRLADGARATECDATWNTGHGFWADSNATLDACHASTNSQHGFYFATGCTVTRCIARSNGNGTHAGFYSAGSRNRIEANQSLYNSNFGFKLDGTVNLVIRNEATENFGQNYSIVAGNRIGSIVVLPTSSASGNVGGSGTSDSAANFAY